MFHARHILLLTLCMSLFLTSCKEVQKFTDIFTNPSAREVYGRTHQKDSNFTKWQATFQKALKDSLFINIPYLEVGTFSPQYMPTYSYNTTLERGEILMVEGRGDSTTVFIDIFHYNAKDSLADKALITAKLLKDTPIHMPVTETGTYKIIIQPELYASDTFQLEIYTKPSLVFPVTGFSDKAIQSFWGNPRSGGTRTHEGIDIFAPRSTPVVAVTNGYITFKGDRGLGGKQVWLRDGLFGISYYYAHLDSIKATTTKVKAEDTLGYVGNTGNAKTTAPHLHFGIYTSHGAIDPLPFVRNRERRNTKPAIPKEKGVMLSRNGNVRMAPNSASPALMTLKNNDTLFILGKSENWYHILSSDSLKGFINTSLIKELN